MRRRRRPDDAAPSRRYEIARHPSGTEGQERVVRRLLRSRQSGEAARGGPGRFGGGGGDDVVVVGRGGSSRQRSGVVAERSGNGGVGGGGGGVLLDYPPRDRSCCRDGNVVVGRDLDRHRRRIRQDIHPRGTPEPARQGAEGEAVGDESPMGDHDREGGDGQGPVLGDGGALRPGAEFQSYRHADTRRGSGRRRGCIDRGAWLVDIGREQGRRIPGGDGRGLVGLLSRHPPPSAVARRVRHVVRAVPVHGAAPGEGGGGTGIRRQGRQAGQRQVSSNIQRAEG